MNPFRSALANFPLSADSQGDGAWLYLMLLALADAEDLHPTANTYPNPWKELLHRLRKYQGFAYQRLEQLIGNRILEDGHSWS